MMIKIERKVIPLPVKGRWSGLAESVRKMKPGDSFYFEDVAPVKMLQKIAFALMKGRYAVRKEGRGFRFFLIK